MGRSIYLSKGKCGIRWRPVRKPILIARGRIHRVGHAGPADRDRAGRAARGRALRALTGFPHLRHPGRHAPRRRCECRGPQPLVREPVMINRINCARPMPLTLLVAALLTGCSSFGPSALQQSRLQYNEAVKTTGEQQLLLNIVRLRYTDTPSSLAVSAIAAQFELTKNFQLTPFFVASGAEVAKSYAAVLPQLGIAGADRPTFTLTPLDDQEFTRKLFTPVPLDGILYLAKTTWPIATVFRLYLENLNWVPNAQTASGPTPKQAPIYREFLQGIRGLQALQERGQLVFTVEERAEVQGSPLPAGS